MISGVEEGNLWMMAALVLVMFVLVCSLLARFATRKMSGFTKN